VGYISSNPMSESSILLLAGYWP